jgi:hypothetical protein
MEWDGARRDGSVYLTVGNQPGYRGNRSNRTGPVTAPASYQLVVFKIFGFEFKKFKNEEEIPKNTS